MSMSGIFHFILGVVIWCGVLSMFIKAFGDCLPIPACMSAHNRWGWGWVRESKPSTRYWTTIWFHFALEVILGANGMHVLSFAVFLRFMIYVLGYRRVMIRIRNTGVPRPTTITRAM